jgi:hypothetical protein
MQEPDEEYVLPQNWAQKSFLNSMNHLIEIAQKGGNDAYIVEGLLHVTAMYLDEHLYRDKFYNYELCNKFNFLRELITKKTFAYKIQTFEQSMAIGQFIDILILHGLPRSVAIEGTAIWLKKTGLQIGTSTVRTHNENYRKIYSEQPNRGLWLIGYLKIMLKKIDDLDKFPTGHPKAKIALKKTKAYYLERTDVEKIFIDALTEGTQKISA